MNHDKIIIDLCGGTSAWSKPYRDAGYTVYNLTLPACDVRDLHNFKTTMPYRIYGILAAPPCTMFCSAGRVWKRTTEQIIDAISIVTACLRICIECQPVFFALENPVSPILVKILGKPQLIFNPCDYGDPWTKKTALWGNFNIPKQNKVQGGYFLPHKILSSKASDNQIKRLIENKFLPENYKELYGDIRDRSAIRSITPPGFAKAFFEANQ